jgi:hypothetical protein
MKGILYTKSTRMSVPSSVLDRTPPASECVSPLGPKGGGHQSLVGEEVGRPSLHDGRESLALGIEGMWMALTSDH